MRHEQFAVDGFDLLTEVNAEVNGNLKVSILNDNSTARWQSFRYAIYFKAFKIRFAIIARFKCCYSEIAS